MNLRVRRRYRYDFESRVYSTYQIWVKFIWGEIPGIQLNYSLYIVHMLPVKLDQVLFSIACERRFWRIAVLLPCDQYHKDNEFNREMSFWVDITIFKGSVENLTNFEKVHQQFIFGLFFEKLFFTSFSHFQWWFFTNPYHLELIQERNIGWWASLIRKIQFTLNDLHIIFTYQMNR